MIHKQLKIKWKEARAFIKFVAIHFMEDDCTYRASALTFTTLLAMVPLMSVSISVLSTFPVFEGYKDPLQDFIFENFVPATGKAVQAYLQQFVNQVSKLSLVGVVFLFATALLVMYTIERAMNKIWRVGNARKGVSAFLLYWAILSLAPVLLGLSLAASSYFFSLPLTRGYHTPVTLLRMTPALLSLMGFTFLYVVVPNCRVKLAHGFTGAIVATLLFETAKKGFAFYLSQYNTYELLYGAFATIPMFFIWIYWVWLITLIGAEISYALSVHYERRHGTPIDGFSQALVWLHCLWKAQQAGESVTQTNFINTSQKPFSVDVGDMTSIFIRLKIIKVTSNGNFILSRDLDNLPMYELARILPFPLPSYQEIKGIGAPFESKWRGIIEQTDKALQKGLDFSLGSLFRSTDV